MDPHLNLENRCYSENIYFFAKYIPRHFLPKNEGKTAFLVENHTQTGRFQQNIS